MKVVLYWIIAILITFSAMIYQRATGPTYDKKTEISIDGEVYKFELVRSHGGENDCKIELNIPDQNITGILEYRKFPTNEDWTVSKMKRNNDNLLGVLPHLPPAGKYEYLVVLEKDETKYPLNNAQAVVIRFKGDVPASILIPHIFFMFFAMFLGNLAGIMAIFKYKKYKLFTNLTVIALFIGGMILGPGFSGMLLEKRGAGVPFAWDLTDNKTLLAFIFWLIAFFTNRKKERPVYALVAAVIMLLVYSIPHSMYGSQLDPETGEIIQGWIRFFLI